MPGQVGVSGYRIGITSSGRVEIGNLRRACNDKWRCSDSNIRNELRSGDRVSASIPVGRQRDGAIGQDCIEFRS